MDDELVTIKPRLLAYKAKNATAAATRASARVTSRARGGLGVGGTLGPVIAGAFYDAYETYLPGFIFGACALALAAVSVHVEAKPPDEAATTPSVVV